MSKIRHLLLAIVALLLAMLTITPSAMADMRGIDVSGWQPSAVTCTTDYGFSVVKATQGTGFTNGYMTSQARCAQQRGKSLGFYHYAGGGNATAEADYFVNTVRPYIGRAILVLDWEGYQNAAWGNFNWVRISVNRVHAGTGVWPLVYTSAAYLYQIPSDVRSRCGLWGGAIRQQQRHRLPDATVELRALRRGHAPVHEQRPHCGLCGPVGSELLPWHHSPVEQVRQPRQRQCTSSDAAAPARTPAEQAEHG